MARRDEQIASGSDEERIRAECTREREGRLSR